MCHSVYLSTTSPEDLGALGSSRCRFTKDDEETQDPESRAVLASPHRWYLSTFGGCSCHLRHTDQQDRAEMFGPPEDWNPEDEDDVEETAIIYDVLRRLVDEGHQVDVVDLWTDTPLDSLINVPVRLSEIPRESFRFVVGVRLVLAP